MHTHDDLLPAVLQVPVPAPARPGPGPAVARAVGSAPEAGPATTPEALLELQRAAGNASVGSLVARQAAGHDEDGATDRSPVLDVVGRGGGRPLDPGLRHEMEARLGADFGGVRIHTDSEASQSAQAVNAHAYTVGTDVVFRSDRWNPDSTDGKTTLAHELTHVIQQATGPVSGTATGDGIRLSDPGDGFELAADANARSAMATALPAPGPAGPIAAAAQRQATPEEEGEEEQEEEATAAQGDFAQRQATPEEEGEEEQEEATAAQGDFVQRQATPEEEEEEEEEATAAQGDFVQRQATPEEEEEEQAQTAAG